MSYIDINLGPSPLAKLEPLGLKMPTLRGAVRLHVESTFEPPLFVQATIPHATRLKIGAFCSISGGQIGQVEMGRYCAVAPDVIMGTHEHPVDWLTCSRVTYFPEVHGWDKFCNPGKVDEIKAHRVMFKSSCPITRIGNDVWIGQGAFIKSGITIGDGAVIGARSVVVKDVPPYSIVVGTPGRVVKSRFDERIVQRLLALRWWRFSLYDLYGVPFDKVEVALEAIEERIARNQVTEYAPQPYTPHSLKMALAA